MDSLDEAIASIPVGWALDHLCQHYHIRATPMTDGKATCKLGRASVRRDAIFKVQAEGNSLAEAVRNAIVLAVAAN